MSLLCWQAPFATASQIPAPESRPRTTSAAQRTARPAAEAPKRESFATTQSLLAKAESEARWSDALEIAERQRELFPREMKASVDLADQLLRQKALDRAETLYREALRQRSVEYKGETAALRGSIYLGLGQISLERGQTDEAISQLQRAIDYSPTIARARFLLASAFAKAGDVERSDRELRAAFDVDPSVAMAGDYALLAQAMRRAGDLNAAASALTAATKQFPANADLRIARADVLRDNKQPVLALYELIYAQMLVAENAPAAREVAARIARVRTETEAAAEPDPEIELLFAYLDDAMTDQHDEALQSIHEALRLNRGNAFIPNLLLAQSYRATGRYGEAEKVLKRLVEADPSSLPVLEGLVEIYLAQGRRDSAQPILERARSLAPNSSRIRELIETWGE